MSSTVLVLIVSIVLLFIILIFLFIFRTSVEIKLENENILVLKYPLTTKRVNLEQELENWKVQKAHYIRWGIVHSINMLFRDGKRVNVNSRFGQHNYELLHNHLSSRFPNREVPDK
ncbi:hypothetical protein [Cesiribacter sp. SM1]|uniref:hypothetical protein n=1 Tax=Cesiribacter sp. SM1 TaxID=2861196 RepID=UPI001CD7AABC|nr:hypothetical protein [Cesiribacter sp. SM1]